VIRLFEALDVKYIAVLFTEMLVLKEILMFLNKKQDLNSDALSNGFLQEDHFASCAF
jgi:hypothetical protein